MNLRAVATFATFVVCMCAVHVVAAEPEQESWEIRLAGGYPTVASVGAGGRALPRLVLAADVGMLLDTNEPSGVTVRVGATYELLYWADGAVFVDAGVLRSVLPFGGGCLESDPQQCGRTLAWLGELGAGATFRVAGADLRLSAFVMFAQWDKPTDYDRARDAYGEGGVPELFQILPGGRFVFAF